MDEQLTIEFEPRPTIKGFQLRPRKKHDGRYVRAGSLQLQAEVFPLRHAQKGCQLKVRGEHTLGNIPVIRYRLYVLRGTVHGLGPRFSGLRENSIELREVRETV